MSSKIKKIKEEKEIRPKLEMRNKKLENKNENLKNLTNS